MNINWYPGHMVKAKRQIKDELKLIDVAIEILDARIPQSSRNPDITDIIKEKPHIIVLNKCDLADDIITDMWVKAFEKEYAVKTIPINALNGSGIRRLLRLVEDERKKITSKRNGKGLKARPVRVMMLGIPNVGKSKLINAISGTNKVKVENKPGITRSLSWVRLKSNIELMDTPGLLWPKQNDQNVAVKLALAGTIKSDINDKYKLCIYLIDILQEIKPKALENQYGIEVTKDAENTLGSIAIKRGCIIKGGNIDFERTSQMILSDFSTGKLGKVSLEKPGGINM